jgi:hypothetical protein
MMSTIGFVSTRFAGSDGVSLESTKWAEILETEGHRVVWFAGELDKSESSSMLVPEAHFIHPDSVRINEEVWGKLSRSPEINKLIKSRAQFLKGKLYEFTERFDVNILIVENAVTNSHADSPGYRDYGFYCGIGNADHRPSPRFLLGTDPIPHRIRQGLSRDGVSAFTPANPARRHQLGGQGPVGMEEGHFIDDRSQCH